MIANQASPALQNFANHLIIVWLAVSAACFTANAGDCDIPQNNQDIYVGVYAEWSGMPDAQSKQYDQLLFDHLSNYVDSDDSLSFCTVTKTVFPPLGAENLFNAISVGKMLSNTAELAGNETFLKKLEKFNVKYLVFVKADRTSLARFSAVRITPSGLYPKARFAHDYVEPFDERSRREFFDKIVGGVKKLSQRVAQPEFPVIITCFVDNIREAALPEWKMDELVTLIPKKLTIKLWREKHYFQTFFPVRFEGNCPFKGLDRDAYALKYEKRWFAWTGTISMRGTKVYVAVDFVHLDIPPWPVEWKRESSGIDMDRLHDDIYTTIESGWETYLKSLRTHRGDLPLLGDVKSGTLSQ